MFTNRQASEARKSRSEAMDDRGRRIDIDPHWAWSAFKPDAKRPWTLPLAGHLYRRTAFGGSMKQLRQATEQGPRRTIDQLLRPTADIEAFDRMLDADEDAVARSGSVENVRAWWLRRMIETPFALRENLTLFWHGHFGVSVARVDDAAVLVRHVRMLRQHALGAYRPMLAAAARDPAVLLAVGADKSRKAMPNENFARQLMQRFSLGPGNFGDEDVREAARAFTGWFVLRGRVRFLAHEHDPGAKSVLGHRGQWNAQDVVRIVLDQPATPRMLVGKLYRWFISETDSPADALLEPLVQLMGPRQDVGRVVETILRSNLFFSPIAYRQRVKSPIDYAVGIVRALEARVPTLRLGSDLTRLGQSLYAPPTVDGWQGGRNWINPATMLMRANLADALFTPKGPYGTKLDPAKVAGKYGCEQPRAAGEFLVKLFLQDDIPDRTRAKLLKGMPPGQEEMQSWLREVARRAVTSPEFQLA